MPIEGPIIPKFSRVRGQIPSIVKNGQTPAGNGKTGDFVYPAEFGELITNTKDGRLWLRKSLPLSDEILQYGFDPNNVPNVFYRYNFEQIGGPYVIMEKTGGHTFEAEDTGRILFMNNGTTANIKIPSYTGASGVDFVVGTHIMLIQGTTQPIYISGATGVTIDVKNNSYTFDIQNGFIQCLKIAQDRWLITGDRDTAGLASQVSLVDIANDVTTIESLLNSFGSNGYGGATW